MNTRANPMGHACRAGHAVRLNLFFRSAHCDKLTTPEFVMIAVMQTDLVRRHRLTVEEYFRMAEVGLLAPDARVELIEKATCWTIPVRYFAEAHPFSANSFWMEHSPPAGYCSEPRSSASFFATTHIGPRTYFQCGPAWQQRPGSEAGRGCSRVLAFRIQADDHLRTHLLTACLSRPPWLYFSTNRRYFLKKSSVRRQLSRMFPGLAKLWPSPQ
jgi:hypothetical protein